MKKGILVVLAAATSVLGLRAQERAGHGEHAHPRNEAGLSLGAAYGIEHKEWAPAIHAHYFRTLAQSLGPGRRNRIHSRRGASLGDRRRSEISGTERSSTVADAGHIDRRQSEVFPAHRGRLRSDPSRGLSFRPGRRLRMDAGSLPCVGRHTCRFCILNGKDHEQVWDHPAQHCHDSPGGNLYRGLVGCEPDRLVARNASTGAVVRTVPKREKTMNNFLKTECGK